EGKAGFEALKVYSEKRLPHALPLLQLGEGAHKAHDFDHIMESLSSPKIKLASGAWLMIEETEAMVSIDVNSGSATEKTPLAINLEAVPEIAEQLSLRSLGGLIAIDFVDMEKEEEREKLINSLRDEFENSPTPNRIADISPFGVVEMTRKRPGLSWKEQAKWLDE
ncbi:MAG: ribonuclease E/G, partial [Parvibaculales bacterium]